MLLALTLIIANSESPDPARLRDTVERLASLHTRNTSSPQLEEAADWVGNQMRKLQGMDVELMHYRIEKSRRVPADKEVVQVIGTLKGETDHRIVISGHLDSINLAAEPLSGRAPGANDDASGVALMMECARLMAGHRFHNTLMFVATTGEEQALLGSTALAKRAKAEGWKIDAWLNNDIVGSSETADGRKDKRHVRVFSEESEKTNSRELARFIEFANRKSPVRVQLVFRPDRFGRGGDHTPPNHEGFSAVRFTEVWEEYSRQHTELDLPQFVDFKYLAGVTQANLSAALLLAGAGDAPAEVRVSRKQEHDTPITWRAKPGVNYTVYWRPTTDPTWRGWKNVGSVDHVALLGMSKDDNVYAVGADGGVPVEAR